MTTDTKKIEDRLEKLQSEIDIIKQHIVDVDLVMTDDDTVALQKSEEDLKTGKTVRI